MLPESLMSQMVWPFNSSVDFCISCTCRAAFCNGPLLYVARQSTTDAQVQHANQTKDTVNAQAAGHSERASKRASDDGEAQAFSRANFSVSPFSLLLPLGRIPHLP